MKMLRRKAHNRPRLEIKYIVEVVKHFHGTFPISMPGDGLYTSFPAAQRWVEDMFHASLCEEVPPTCLAGWVRGGVPSTPLGTTLEVVDPADVTVCWWFGIVNDQLRWVEKPYSKNIHEDVPHEERFRV